MIIWWYIINMIISKLIYIIGSHIEVINIIISSNKIVFKYSALHFYILYFLYVLLPFLSYHMQLYDWFTNLKIPVILKLVILKFPALVILEFEVFVLI